MTGEELLRPSKDRPRIGARSRGQHRQEEGADDQEIEPDLAATGARFVWFG